MTLEQVFDYISRVALPPFDPASLPGDVTLDHTFAGAPAVFAGFPSDLNEDLAMALRSRGIDRLYSHQAEARAAAKAGRHVVVVTPTASGKTLCYNLPVLERILERPESRALYLFPTKALAQDQMVELGEMTSRLPVELLVHTYDGDTPAGQRTAIREAGHIVLTNPDMLHTGVLPHHTRWRKLFSGLEYVVIDELHTYRGLFGTRVANVLHRLQQICRLHGSAPFPLRLGHHRQPTRALGPLPEELPVDRRRSERSPRGDAASPLLEPAPAGAPRARRAAQSILEGCRDPAFHRIVQGRIPGHRVRARLGP